MLSAVLIPAMTGATGLGIEVSYWSLQQIELQHIADAAAIAATIAANGGSTAQVAANAAADIAELNGIPGSGTRNWDATNNILTDNHIRVAKIAGFRATSDVTYQASITQSVPLVIAQLFSTLSSVTVSAIGYAEVVTPTVQGCLMLTGNSGTTLSLSNGGTVTESNCATATNGNVSVTGGATLNTGGLTAGGSITISNGATITGTYKANAGTFTDPYATDTPTQTAMTTAASATGPAMTYASGTFNVYPGSYSSITLTNGANVTFNPGTYYINGAINMGGAVVVNGTGVTIVFTGAMATTNGATVNLTAPLANAAVGIPGVALIGTSSNSINFGGGSAITMTGVLYAPNAPLTLSNGFATSSSTCSIVIANSIAMTGGTKLANNCTTSSGVKSLAVPVGTATVVLVK